MSKRCASCNGSGQMLGLGGIYKDCAICEGNGIIKPPVALDKRSKSYKEAIKRLKDIGLSEEQAHAEFAK